MTSLPNRHNFACLPQRSRPALLTQRRPRSLHIFRTMPLGHHAEQGSRYGTVT